MKNLLWIFGVVWMSLVASAQDWDKTFPKSPKVDVQKVKFKN